MAAMWLTVRYLADWVRGRIGEGRCNGDAGALSLEWIVIAVLLVGAAGMAYVFFRGAIATEARRLP